MNYKTTLYLVVAAAACVIIILVVKPERRATFTEAIPTKTPEERVERTLVDPDDFPDVTQVVCKLRDQDGPVVFEKRKENDKDVWYVTKPYKARAVSYQVDRISGQMTSLRYDIAYTVGEGGGVTPEEAGLAPPEAEVTITDRSGKTATIEIGKSAGRSQTYAMLKDGNTIALVKYDIMSLFKDRAIEYRDQRVFDFAIEDVQRIEITDSSADHADQPVQYVLTRSDGRWQFEAPFSARATTKVDSMLAALSRFRVSKWVDNDPGKLGVYGLEKPALSISVTVRETVEDEPEEDSKTEGQDKAEDGSETDNADADADAAGGGDAKEKTTHEETHIYTLHVSALSPLGEDNMFYARADDEPAVGTVLKTTAEKLKPVEREWRDMRVTRAKVTDANRVRIKTRTASADLIRKGAQWWFSGENRRADDESVRSLLAALSEMNARTFVPFSHDEAASFGLDAPRVRLRLTIPGQDEPERIMVGGATDEQLKRLVYVRHNESMSVAKVKADAVSKLIRPVTAYRSRAFFELEDGTFKRIEVVYENPFDSGKVKLAFAPESDADDVWRMVEPVEAPVQDKPFKELLDSLGTLKAKRFVAAEDDPARYGLDDPSLKVTLTYLPPKVTRLVPAGEGSGDDADADHDEKPAAGGDGGSGPYAEGWWLQEVEEQPSRDQDNDQDKGQDKGQDKEEGDDSSGQATRLVPVQDQPPAQMLDILVSNKDGIYYAKRSDREAVYELDSKTVDRFMGEYRDQSILSFEQTQVTSFEIREGETTYVFKKTDAGWVSTAEPDLALDQRKMENLLVQLADLKTERYVRYGVKRLARYGLDEPAHEVVITLDDGQELRVVVSERTCEKDPRHRHYGVVGGTKDVFLLTSSMMKRFKVDMANLEAPG